MSEFPPPVVAGAALVHRSPALTPERVAAILADFQAWLVELPGAGDEIESGDAPAGPDLFTLLEQLTALRHEVNLQTKASRSLQEQNTSTLAQLTRALDALQQAQASTAAERDERLRPLLKTLIELHDAVSIAGREAQRVQDILVPELKQAGADEGGELPEFPVAAQPGWLARLLGIRGLAPAPFEAWKKRESARTERMRDGLERINRLLSSLTSGYAMGLQRIERALKQQGLEPIQSVGQPFDPERMEAIEAVPDHSVPNGQVLEEVQRGYLWNGRIFRFAKVRVAKNNG